MKQEDKELLLKDLCARLPYHPMLAHQNNSEVKGALVEVNSSELIISPWGKYDIEECKPFLRPMSSMTDEEAKHLFLLHNEDRKEHEILEVSIGDKYLDFKIDDGCCSFELHTIWYEDAVGSTKSFDWLNAHHFDYRGLIEKGLALEAPEGMYNK